MPFLYHLKPKPMLGDILYPLNDLKHVDLELYRYQLAKYDDHPRRKQLPKRIIPKLGCLWNDVLHFSPVHPYLIYRAWLELGRTLDDALFYRVPVERVAPHPAVIYDSSGKRSGDDVSLPESSVTWFDESTFTELKKLPQTTLEWYAELNRRGRVGAFFVGIPHVLVRGAIEVNDEDLVGWQTSPV